MESSNSECLIDDSEENYFEIDNDCKFTEKLNLKQNISYCEPLFPSVRFIESSDYQISLQISTLFLPKYICHINSFDQNPILCNIIIDTNKAWTKAPQSIVISNPTLGPNFIGKNLIAKRIRSFFTPEYKPSSFYFSQNYILVPNVIPDHSKLDKLMKKGFEKEECEYALRLMENDLSQSINYLETGVNSKNIEILDVEFCDCPLFYLILEMTEVFFELSDHCCICERTLDISGIKPLVCNDKICNFSFTEIGVSANIIGEIRRDPTANDLLISLASTTFQTKFFDPKPPNITNEEFYNFFNTLPSMNQLVKECKNDQELKKILKNDKNFEILKFLILANKAHIITLNQPEIQIKECSDYTIQFLLVIAPPEFEKEFQKKKKKYGSLYLWHGSNVNRWYSILHNGLKDLGRTVDRVHAGPIYGDGIYQSNSSSYSLPYSYSSQNLYINSCLPKNLKVLAMTENAKTQGQKILFNLNILRLMKEHVLLDH